MEIALLLILVFRSDDSGCRLFQIFWILHPRPLLFDAQYLTQDIHCWCSRYISLSTPDSTLPSRAFMHPIVYQNWSLQDVYTSSLVAIGLPAFWFSSSSHYPGYAMKKLTFHHKGRRPIASKRLLNLTTNRDAQRW